MFMFSSGTSFLLPYYSAFALLSIVFFFGLNFVFGLTLIQYLILYTALVTVCIINSKNSEAEDRRLYAMMKLELRLWARDVEKQQQSTQQHQNVSL
jgi:hypothetical protein